MGFRLIEIHLPGQDFDKKNILPHEYHGVLKMLYDAGINPLTVIVVTYSTETRDKLTREAEASGKFNTTYTGTYGGLPDENLTEFLTGYDRQWDIIIAGRFWGSCHYSAYANILLEINKRNPTHVNFHFIKPLIDGINKEEFDETETGSGTYSTDAFHTALIFRSMDDGVEKHVECKDTKWRGSPDKELPSSKTTIDLHYWTSLEKMIEVVKKGGIL